MASTTLNMRIDDQLKRDATAVVNHYGLDLPTATRLFYTQIVNTGAIPLDLSYDGEPNAESLQAIRDTEDMARTGTGRRFSNAHDLLTDALEQE